VSRVGFRAVWAFATLSAAGLALGIWAAAFGSPSTTSVPHPIWTTFVFFPAACAFPIVGALVASRQPRNAVGWILLGFGLIGAVQVPAGLYADHRFMHHQGPLPGDEVAAWLADWLGQTSLFAVVLFLPLLFPTGRPPTPRWRPVVWLAAIVLAGTTIGRMLVDDVLGEPPWSVHNPFGVLPPIVYDAFNVSGAFVVPLSLAALVVRFRRSRGDERLQLKWLVCAAVVMAFFFVGALAVSPFSSTLSDVSWGIGIVGFIALPVVTGIAILRYRLYEIDVIISRTLLYGALTACVVGAYAAVIALAGALLREQVGIGAAVVATGLVAVMFDPLRTRLQRGVNRLLYGERDDPATAVARLARRLEAAAAPDAVLPGVVETVAQALRLPYAAIEVEQDGRLERVAVHGKLAGVAVALPLAHHGAQLGHLVLGLRPGDDAFSPEDSRVLGDLAEHAGQAVHAVRLTADLQRARERIVAAREEERRMLRRDLHDGIGPTLAGITLQVDLARSRLGGDEGGAREMVEKLRAETQAAVEDVRRVVEALRPPDLDELGLAGAIRRLEIECETSADLDRLPAAVEVAAYRIVQEARGIQRVRIERNGALEIEITGRAAGIARLAAMRERAGELGGSCTLEALPGGEFCVRASLPLREVPA
jgi:two-component system NarL family sensor kinase